MNWKGVVARLLARGNLQAWCHVTLEAAAVAAAGVARIRRAPKLNRAAGRADPAAGDHTHDIRPAHDAHHTVAAQHRPALEAITGDDYRDLVYGDALLQADY